MATAVAFQTVIQDVDYIRLDAKAADVEGDDTFLLDAARSHSGSEVAVIYAS